MAIQASDVVKLRTITGAGMMDCKNALEETGGDMEKAADLLRKKGIVKAAKRADKIASEGLTMAKENGDAAAVIEVNCETDFVAKNDDFKRIVEDLLANVLENKPSSVEQAMAGAMSGATVLDYLNGATAKIGEKISLRRFMVMEKGAGEFFGSYIHMGGSISVLVLLSGGDENLARDIAMHAAAANPKCLDRSEVSSGDTEREKAIYVEQLKAQGKPENMIENILKGKMEKYYEDVCLVDQVYIKDESKKIKDLLGEAKIKKFVRYELGEGMEKKSEDFSAEVESQLR